MNRHMKTLHKDVYVNYVIVKDEGLPEEVDGEVLSFSYILGSCNSNRRRYRNFIVRFEVNLQISISGTNYGTQGFILLCSYKFLALAE